MVTIENEMLKVTINPAGAELNSIFNKASGLEYLWSGDPKFWAKRSPVLFPIVGTLKHNEYIFNDKSYHLGRHGFAREKTFSVIGQSQLSVSFELQEDESTLAVYPFQFSFIIAYTISEHRLTVSYTVKNKGAGSMFFSVGGHPAFKLPIIEGLSYDDYFLLFDRVENAPRWPISAEGLIETLPEPLLNNTNKLGLSKSLFYKDALVFKDLRSPQVELKSDKHPAGFSFSFDGFPFLGIWAAKDADFVCIEPWCGIADSTNSNQLLTEKEGINELAEGEVFERSWSITTW